jgi:anti-anti-sigma factor
VKLKVQPYPEVTVIKIEGELSCMSAEDFSNAIEEVIKKKPENIAINMHDVSFVDSTGLGALINNSNACHFKDIPLYLFSLNRTINIVFEVSKLNTMFRIIKKREIEKQFNIKIKD